MKKTKGAAQQQESPLWAGNTLRTSFASEFQVKPVKGVADTFSQTQRVFQTSCRAPVNSFDLFAATGSSRARVRWGSYGPWKHEPGFSN